MGQSTSTRNFGMAALVAMALGGCADFEMPKLKLGKGSGATEGTSTSVRLVERDVEAPEVFQVTDNALWDGRPSLGGVWIAHPAVDDPERVIIRNEANGKFVIGALFRRERDNPGPVLQLSSDAAAALDVLAGAPTELNVTALRRKQVPDETAVASEAAVEEDVTAETLGPIAAAAAAIEEAEAIQKGNEATASAAAQPAAAAPVTSSLKKPYVQVGIFSVEANARGTAETLQKNGIAPVVKAIELKGKKFWRVLGGPAATSRDLKSLTDRIQGLGFKDAYAVAG